MSEGRNKTRPALNKVLVDHAGCQEEQDMANKGSGLKTQGLDGEIVSVMFARLTL